MGPPRLPRPAAGRQQGVTLVELLAALVISAFTVAMASRIFLSGHFQFMERSSESERLGEFYRLKGTLQAALKKEISRCAAGSVWFPQGDKEKELELGASLKAHFPSLLGSDFRCLEVASDSASLTEWKTGVQPPLIEYRLVLGKRGKTDTLEGSWIK